MKCAAVLIVKNFSELDEAYAFDYAFRSLAQCNLSEPYYVLVAEGFRNLPRRFVSRWKSENIHIVDGSSVLESLLRDYPHLRSLSAKRAFRSTFLRHLILERVFAGEAVLSVDADVVWRVDPYKLFGQWNGGFLAVGGSGFLTYAQSPEWFQAYRTGLESVIAAGELAADFSTDSSVTRIMHDQHLIQHLVATGLMTNEWVKCWSTEAFRDLCLRANPLSPKTGFRKPPARLAFRRENDREYFNDSLIPFWHMQTGFSTLCSFLFIRDALDGEPQGRLPFPAAKSGEGNLKASLMRTLRRLILDQKISERSLRDLRPLMSRRGVYEQFFTGDLPHRLFTDEVWWEPDVFA
jgi:hypothetical protein